MRPQHVIMSASTGCCLLMACTGSSTPSISSREPSVAARTALIAPGDLDCPFGGTLVETGIDDNGNGTLDVDEVDQSEKLCNGSAGFSSLVNTAAEPAGSNCALGGVRIDSGLDTDRSGTLESAEITQTSYVCAVSGGSVWSTPMLIEDHDGGDANDPQIAVDGSGNAFAAWSQSDGMRTNIWANRYEAGTGWGTAVMIETNDVGDAGEVHIAASANGEAIAVWAQEDGMRVSIWANRYDRNSGWGSAALVESEDAGEARIPRVTIEPSGDAFAVWRQSDGSFDSIWANRFINGAWATAEPIENDSGNADLPRIATDGNGNAVAIWRHPGSPHTEIGANRFSAGSGWGSHTIISTDNVNGVFSASLVADSGGNAIAVWQEFTASLAIVIKSSVYTPDAGWSDPEEISAIGRGDSGEPDIDIDASGNAFAVWRNGTDELYANRYAAGGWEIAQLLVTDILVVSPRVAADTGNAFVTWTGQNVVMLNIYALEYVDGAGWNDFEKLVETNNLGDAINPEIAADGSGNVFVVWQQSDGTRQSIWANKN